MRWFLLAWLFLNQAQTARDSCSSKYGMFPVVPCGVSCELDDTIVIALSHVRHVFNFSEIAFQDPISKLRLISGMQISKIVLKFTFHEQQTAFWVVSSRFRMCGVSNRCIHRHWTWDWSTHSKWYCYELVSREIRDLTYVLPFVRCFQCVVLGICVCEFWTRCGIFWQAWSIKSRLLLGRYSHPVFIARSWFGRYIAINVGRVLSEKLGSWGTQPRSLASLEMVSGSSTEA